MGSLAIYKYTLEPRSEQSLDMPQGARVLSVEEQRGAIVLYALVDPLAAETKRRVVVYGTGQEVKAEHADWPFVGTVKLMEGTLMFHVFDGGSEENHG